MIEDMFRQYLPFLEIVDPILRLAANKNKNIVPVSAVVTVVVSSLKKYLTTGNKKLNPVALKNITDLLHDVDPDMTKKDANAFINRLKAEMAKMEKS